MNMHTKTQRNANPVEDMIKEKNMPAATTRPRTSTRHSYPLQKGTVNPRAKEKEKEKVRGNSIAIVIIVEFMARRRTIAGRNKNNMDTPREQTKETGMAVRAGVGDTGTKEMEKEKDNNTV